MRLAPLLAVLMLIGACAWGPSRSLVAIRATAYGGMPTPPGSGLVRETFIPAHTTYVSELTPAWRLADMERIFATNDPAAFEAALMETARVRAARLVWDRGNPRERLWEIGYPVLSLEVDATKVSVSFEDLDSSGLRGLYTDLIDRRAWRWKVTLRIQDIDDP
jgi:hypothetical protein